MHIRTRRRIDRTRIAGPLESAGKSMSEAS
jgi:hypothetical protein